MNPLPPLTEAEFGLLRESIRQDGVKYPVLLDRSGNIIDGFHRKQILEELGIHDYPSQVVDVDTETADRLRITLNVARRQLTALDRAEMINWLASRHEAKAKAEARERKAQGGRGGLATEDCSGREQSSVVRADEVIAQRINEDLAKMGETKRVTRSTVEKSRRIARLSAEAKARIRAGESTVQEEAWNRNKKPKGPVSTGALRDRPTRDADLGQAARIRATDAELQYQSMLNAPEAKLNLPLLRRAEKISELLTELIGVAPEVAASQLPPDRCRDFTVAHAAWWSAFAAACDERRARETPDLAPRPYRPPHAVLNPVVLGSQNLPKEERHLMPSERAVLDWIRSREEPVTATEIAVGVRNRSRNAIQTRLRALAVSGLIEVAGKAGKELAYRPTDSTS